MEPRKNISSNVIDMEEMAQKAIAEQKDKLIKELEAHNLGLGQTVDKLMTELERKEATIKHLEQLLGGSAQIIQTGVITQVSDEEIITMRQLEYLKRDAMVRPLTLDEMKILDLAVKNKRLSQGNATDIKGSKSNINTLSSKELLQIAATPLKNKNVEDK